MQVTANMHLSHLGAGSAGQHVHAMLLEQTRKSRSMLHEPKTARVTRAKDVQDVHRTLPAAAALAALAAYFVDSSKPQSH